jgi:hypothetical protein
MHSDDEGVGRILGRRQALTILGMSGLALTLAGPGQRPRSVILDH